MDEHDERDGIKCPDCDQPLDLFIGEVPEMVKGLVAMLRCDPCAEMLRDHGRHVSLTGKARQAAEEAGRKLVKLDKLSRLSQLNPNQKEELWNLQQKLEQNLRWYHQHKQGAEMVAMRYQVRTGLAIKSN